MGGDEGGFTKQEGWWGVFWVLAMVVVVLRMSPARKMVATGMMLV
jgi:hypothetical protein